LILWYNGFADDDQNRIGAYRRLLLDCRQQTTIQEVSGGMLSGCDYGKQLALDSLPKEQKGKADGQSRMEKT
jgi:hypothetical protein